MTNLCSVSADLSRHLDHQDQGDQYQSALGRKIHELTKTPDFDPFDEDNFNLALEEIDLRPVIAFFKCGLIQEGGRLQVRLVTDYWIRRARTKAEQLIEDACPACLGDGCPSCES